MLCGVCTGIAAYFDIDPTLVRLGWVLFGLLGGVAVTLAVVLPFAWGENIFTWLVDKYAATLSGYPHATLSTGNLMFLLGGNWVDESMALIGGITYGQIGLVLMVLSFAAGMAVYFMGKGRSHLFLAAALTMQLLFALTTKMHERYILPALALLFFTRCVKKTKDLHPIVFIGISAVIGVVFHFAGV